jgi:hypothetical protein
VTTRKKRNVADCDDDDVLFSHPDIPSSVFPLVTGAPAGRVLVGVAFAWLCGGCVLRSAAGSFVCTVY